MRPLSRKALVHIAKGQEEMLDLLEAGAARGAGIGGEEAEDGDEEEDEDAEEEEYDDSELADAADVDEIEEEDHGNGGVEVVVPEVLPAGTRPAEGGVA